MPCAVDKGETEYYDWNILREAHSEGTKSTSEKEIT